MCVPVCFSFSFPSPKEPKGFPRVLMASLMVFPAVILPTATTRQSTSAMAGCLYQRLLFMLMLVMTTTGAGGQDTGSSSVVRILAVFRSIRNGNDGTGHAQDPDCTQQRENGLDGQQWKWWWTMESLSCVVLLSSYLIPYSCIVRILRIPVRMFLESRLSCVTVSVNKVLLVLVNNQNHETNLYAVCLK